MDKNQKEMVRKLRLEGFGYSKIAKYLGVSISTIKSHCRRNNLAGVRDNHLKPEISFHYCQNCGNELSNYGPGKRRKFCSDKCRVTWWNSHNENVNKKAIYKIICQHCKKEFESYGNKNRKYCSHPCYINERFNK